MMIVEANRGAIKSILLTFLTQQNCWSDPETIEYAGINSVDPASRSTSIAALALSIIAIVIASNMRRSLGVSHLTGIV